MAWRLRLRHPGGQATLSLPQGGVSSVAALLAAVQEASGVPASRAELLAGFPPRPLQTGDTAASLDAVGISNGESITLRERTPEPEPTPPQQPPQQAAAGPADWSQPDNGLHASASLDDEDAELAAAIAASLRDSQPSSAAAPAPALQQPQRGAPPPPQQPQQQSQPLGQTPAGKGPAPSSVRLSGALAGSCVVRRIIPSDNSCLFTAVGYVMEHDRHKAAQLRKVIADTVTGDPVTYNEGFLGQDTADYAAWIQKKQHWGGAIELAILAAHYGRQIAAYDIQTKRCDRYGEGSGYGEAVMLLYDGLHYDAMAVSAFEGAPEELDVTVLQVGSREAGAAQAGAQQLVAACHEARQFTDVANFTLRCGVCQVGLKGEKEACEHAKATGHTNFSEY